jgi:pyridoxine 4-dehydrogenase
VNRVLRYCEKHDIGFIPRFPVAAGKLAQPGGPLDKIATRYRATFAQLSIAWLLHHSRVMLTIPGTSRVSHLEENIAAANLHLNEEEWMEVEKPVGVHPNRLVVERSAPKQA